MSPPFRLPPRAYQDAIFAEHGADLAFGVFHEQGLGKTKLLIDVACQRFVDGTIDGLLVVAPGGVDAGWVRDELPKHVWLTVGHTVHRHVSKRAKTRAAAEAAEKLLSSSALAILVITYDGLMTPIGKALVKKFLTRRRTMMVLDESQMIKSPSAKRTRTICAAGKYAVARWIASGTPQPNEVDDLYSQIKFLDDTFWPRHDIANATVFRSRFIITEQRGAPGRKFPVNVGHRDLDILHKWIGELTHRLTKREALPELPPKVYVKRYFAMSDAQTAAYEALRDELRALIGTPTEELVAINPMVRMLRLQQIAGGYVPSPSDPERYVEIDPASENRRLRALLDEIESISVDGPKKIIIWYRFRRDGDLIVAALAEAYGRASVVRYDGTVTRDEDREHAIVSFRSPSGARFLAGNPASIGRGVNLVESCDMIYYTNSHNGEHRWQSEDRSHRLGQLAECVRYVDLVAEGTVDRKITESLQQKKQLEQVVLDGEDPVNWT